MTVKAIIEDLHLNVFCGEAGMEKIVKGGYVSDLLSDVMGNAEEGEIWITMQSHMNVVAIASLKELAAVIIVNEIQPAADVISKAEREGVILLGTSVSTFQTAGKLFNLLEE